MFRAGGPKGHVAVVLACALVLGSAPLAASAGAEAVDRGVGSAEDVPVLDSEPAARDTPAATEPGEAWSRSQPEGKSAPADRPVPVEELADERGRDTQVFRNDDGSLTVREFASPIHYEVDGSWAVIDNSLEPAPGRPGWISTDGNDWQVAFGPSDQGVELVTGAGTLRMTSVPQRQAGDGDARDHQSAPVGSRGRRSCGRAGRSQ